MSLELSDSSSPSYKRRHGSNDSDLLDLEPLHLLYDERMLFHRPVNWVEPTVFPEYPDEVEEDYPMENPERLRVVYERICELEGRVAYLEDTDTVFRRLNCEMATKEQILLAHSPEQYDRLDRLESLTERELVTLTGEMSQADVYYCRESFVAARLAAGGLLSCVDAACEAKDGTNKALALVRPPGHHACQSREMGFCFIDSVVVAAKYALAQKKAKRVCILDWDIHDGNGTSEATIDSEDIFRIDIHRFNPREGFYPYTGAPQEVGNGKAKGLNLNMAWSHGGMGNTEYAAAFYELILPLLANYKPDLLIISCGLDAAMGDLLGGCEVTPDFFHAMTRATLEVVGPDTPVVCALEGGYTMSVLPDCMEAVTLAMLNCPYRYHSSLELGNYVGGATQENRHAIWPLDPLERSRRVLSKYYIRNGCNMILTSAVNDINTSIRIFKGISRWNKVQLHRLKGPHKPKNAGNGGNKRKWEDSITSDTSLFEPSMQRPRVYLWYGTELHHQKTWQKGLPSH